MVSIPRPTDLVLITFERNPLDPSAPITIVTANVVGSASPCTRRLRPGRSAQRAVDCLLANGFVVECAGPSTDVSGYILLQRG
ncbi:hypothetical protein MUG87_01195 [Ectobacillus sp. JY-23]|uniref:hypothetical protein n=1 Tax=Ectobacillus sp. JY-23 TaxID=2933872 RepID=UPI001FF32484|nr:hypothetical protein [Ectobacillus sp. JY-23]UOY92791.1 hypothetical protein MUG87_01195 [Ectobacillus sp. JY-23]